MTSKRDPQNGPYKQLMYPWITWPDKYTLCKMNRSDYMETDVWKMISDKRRKIDNFQCCMCGSAINLQVHHIKYPEVWGEERMEDLRTLCDECHKKLHEADIERGKNE